MTTHKIDLLSAAREMFDELDPCARILGEVSSITKRDGRLLGHAKDPISSGLALEAFLPAGWWWQTRNWAPPAAALLLGAGGSALALSIYLLDPRHGANRRARRAVTNRTLPRLHETRPIHEQFAGGVPCEFHHCPTFGDNDRVLYDLPAGSLMVNATGLGKDRPGSPLTDRARFLRQALAWDFNYRGDLRFLAQARAQQQDRGLIVEDGWTYFIHGWTQVIGEVFHIEIGPAVVAQLSRIAGEVR